MSRVILIAHTSLNLSALAETEYVPHGVSKEYEGYGNVFDRTEWDADELAEFAGRNCYQSFDRPNPDTATNQAYLQNIIDIQHESVLEHASASFYIEASRSVLTELERHRHLSFSVVSQRYVDAAELGHHYPPALDELESAAAAGTADAVLTYANEVARESYRRLVEIFTASGKPRKQAREAARAVLPNMTSSPMVVTGNHRTWRHVIKLRHHEAADAEIREVAGMILEELREIAPNTYQDIPDEPYSY